ncbi:hypothetical protein KM1_102540 [Entamoeba histolytica HM-3:IMSS]|nr:hypothetical protein KM1_102540 [Entamoeba histolytica HM-3:IMSS]
MVTIHISLNSK